MPYTPALFEKRPAEVLDYDIDFADFLATIDDTIESHDVVIETGIGLTTSAQVGSVIKLWISGGEPRKAYSATVTITTEGGRVREQDVIFLIREGAA